MPTLLFVLAAILAPPLGIVMLWMRRGTGVLKKICGSLAIAAWGVAALVLFFGLRFELDGSGVRPMFKIRRIEAHYAELEQNRARQNLQPVPETKPLTEPPTPVAVQPPTGSSTGGAYWTDFRGPGRDGRYDEAPVSIRGIEKPVWKQPVGGGYASFVVAHGRAFTIEQRRRQEVVTAYSLTTGRELWAHGWDAAFQESMGGDGPRACPTWHDGKVYALGAEGELRCLDAQTGKRIWSHNILSDNRAQNLTWGMAAAPLVVDDKLIVLPGGPAGKSVVAYDRLTGAPVWKALDDKASYTSPMLVTLGGKRQLLIVTAGRMVGLTVEDGSLLWQYPWTTEYDINAAQPLVIGGNRVFISAGYGHGSAVVEITPSDKDFQVRQVWSTNRMKNKFSSSVLHEGYIYGLDEAILACISAETGELKWKGGRYGYGQVLLAGKNLIVSTETGDIVAVEATPERHHEIARLAAISGKTWNVPALADGYLLVRNAAEMACFKLATAPE
jgi:outer membrane protein assembly factor BamB